MNGKRKPGVFELIAFMTPALILISAISYTAWAAGWASY